MMTDPIRRALTLTVLGALWGGIVLATPRADAQADADTRVLQQTISQLRMSLDDVRGQRDELRDKFVKAESELETAHRELSFLEAQVRVMRELGSSRATEYGDLSSTIEQKTKDLETARARNIRLERELTTLRAAFDQDQLLVKQLRAQEETLTSEIESLRERITEGTGSWEGTRRELEERLQSKEDEVSVLLKRLEKSETALNITRAHQRSTATAGPPATGDAAADGESFFDEAQAAVSFLVKQIRFFLSDPQENWRLLLGPVPIALIVVTLATPLLIWTMLRKRRRRRAARRAQAPTVQTTQPTGSVAMRREHASVARPRIRGGSIAVPRQKAPIGPQDVGSVAATLDAVLGGDPAVGPDSQPPQPTGGDEDELLGDLKDIVQKGLS